MTKPSRRDVKNAMSFAVEGLDPKLLRLYDAEHERLNGIINTVRYNYLSQVPIDEVAEVIGEAYKGLLSGRYGFIPFKKEHMDRIGDYYGIADHLTRVIGIDVESVDWNPYKIGETYSHELIHLICDTDDDEFVYSVNLQVLDYLSGTDEFGEEVKNFATRAKAVCIDRGMAGGYFDGDTLKMLGYLDGISGLDDIYGGFSFEEAGAAAPSGKEGFGDTLVSGVVNGVFIIPTFVEKGLVRSYLGQFWPDMDTNAKLTGWFKNLAMATYNDYKKKQEEAKKKSQE